MYHDAVTGEEHVPLQTLRAAKASFEIRNSPLSEYACVGFELGYNLQEPGRLVLWEAQYGDFINGAQIILDEYLTSGRAKWGMAPSLVLLLPHGYEGQGPDHSSARLERFLNAAADTNIRIANCTTAAQYFHLLRRQALLLKTDPLPLVVMTPKSLLRHPFTASTPAELAEGRFQRVIDDREAAAQAAKVRRVVLCSGKVAVDLFTSERRKTTRTSRSSASNSSTRSRRIRSAKCSSAIRRARSVLGAGRAGEHGRVGIRAAAARDDPRRPLAAALHRPLAQLEPVGRVVELACRQPAGHRRPGV